MIDPEIIALVNSLLRLLPASDRNDRGVLQELCNAAALRFPRVEGPADYAMWTLLQRSKAAGTLSMYRYLPPIYAGSGLHSACRLTFRQNMTPTI